MEDTVQDTFKAQSSRMICSMLYKVMAHVIPLPPTPPSCQQSMEQI